ncbi:serine hydrolase domain-containing protein [Peristeroidobacter agariperforans]|uniref:serine hydrolase domain-containing protein n=1 Tax=Peristeroidobacter agariperforans TaxID=268404 RepID=UPI00101D73DB|nr:serine hydrolase domain-containing protein [Peristeroidobacter agariperforans]
MKSCALRIGATCLALALATDASAHEFKLNARERQQLESEARRMVDARLTPGIAVGVMSRGQIIYAKGFGQINLETATPTTAESVFQIGSVTKPLTAASIVQLVEQGKLQFDDRLSRYFPDFPRGDEVTLRHLLYHTSGIHSIMQPGEGPPPAEAIAMKTTADVVTYIRDQPNLYDFQPGTATRYSNSGYWLLGAIIEQVSGIPLAEFMKQNSFDRADMCSSALDDATEVVPHRVSGYARSTPGNTAAFINPEPSYLRVSGGAGGIRSTVGDMLRWSDALVNGRLLSRSGLRAMIAPAKFDNGEPLPVASGMGLLLGNRNGHTVWSANGGTTQGFTANLRIFPDDQVAYVVFVNMPSGPADDPTRGIITLLNDWITGPLWSPAEN